MLAPLFKMLEATLELIVPLIIAEMIDSGITQNNKSYIFRLSIQLVMLGLIGLVFSITAQFFSAKASVDTVKRLKHDTFVKCQSLSFAQLDKMGTSTLITRLTSDMDSVCNGINLTLRLLLRSPFVVIGACIMAYRVDKDSFGIFALLVLILSIIVFCVIYFTIPLNKKVRNNLDDVLLSARENITGIRVIRAFNKENEFIDEFKNKNNRLTKFQEYTGRFTSLMNPLTLITVNLSIAALIYTGAVRVSAGIITTGTVVALYNYLTQILVELVKFANLIISVTKSIACSKRISALLDIPGDKLSNYCNNDNDNADSYIEFRNVSFAYNKGADNALDKVSFKIDKGEKVGIIGSTGSGKSTLINLLSGKYPCDKGSVYFEGQNICKTTPEYISEKFAVCEQKPVIFGGTVKSNLLMGNQSADDNAIRACLETAMALDFVEAKENGINEAIDQNGKNFSGGQKQRLSIARALIKNADVLILDDSFSALDYSTEAQLRNNIDSTVKSTVIIVSQRTGSIKNCDKIIVLEDGKAEIGTHESLLESSEVYREIHLAQFEEEVKAV